MFLLIFTAALIAAASDTTTNARSALPGAGSAYAASAYGGPPDTLALGWLEREALRGNPSLAAMRAAAAQARARARVAGSLEDPMVDIAVAPRSYTEPFSGDGAMSGPGGSPASEKVPAYKWSLRQRIPVFGQRGLERRSARAEAAASMLDFEAARLDLLQEVRVAFFELYRIDREIQTIAAQAELMNHFRRVALSRYAAGTEGQQDALQADTELGMLVHGEALLLRERRVMRARLNTLLHRDPALPLPPPPLRIELPALSDTTQRGLAARSPWPELRAS
ncbi:MAG: TolC family protein, partial [Candidatus Eisenbacteria bacterium]